MDYFLTHVHGSTASLIIGTLLFAPVGLALIADGLSLDIARRLNVEQWLPLTARLRRYPAVRIVMGSMFLLAAVDGGLGLAARALA